MYKINWVELINFRSFSGKHRWNLESGGGLFQITGRNNDNPRLDKNGLGKSSLLDAISWCLYGKTTRGLRSHDIINDNHTNCSVCVNLTIKNECITVKTTQNPNSLTLDGRPIDRENLQKSLILNHESFLYSVIIPQFGDSFLDLSPSSKLNLFTQIVELDWCLEKASEAQNRYNSIGVKINSTDKEIASLKARSESITSSIEIMKIKSDEWDSSQATKIDNAKNKKLENINQINSFTEEIGLLSSSISEINNKIKLCETKLGGKNNKIKEFDDEMIEANKEISLINHKISSTRSNITRLKGVGSICPTCNQEVDQQHIVDELVKSESIIKGLFKERTDLDKVVDAIKDDISEIKRDISSISIELNGCKAKYTSYLGNKNSLVTEIEYLRRENTNLDTKISQAESEKNVFSDLITSNENELKRLEKEIASKNEEICLLNEKQAAAHFWIGGFKRLRLFIVEETLRSLEMEVNNNLISLGLPDWTIKFDIERENKSGGVTKGFSTTIIKPSGKSIKYEALCGGEVQRVRLAACFGFANLIMERSGLVGMSEFFDELSQHLSDAGVDDMLATLKDRSSKTGKQVWVIDHRSTAFSDFDGVLIIEKNESGSRLLGM